MFTPLHSSTNQELFKRNACNQSNYYEKYNGAVPSEIEVSIALLCRLCSTRYTAVQIKKSLLYWSTIIPILVEKSEVSIHFSVSYVQFVTQ